MQVGMSALCQIRKCCYVDLLVRIWQIDRDIKEADVDQKYRIEGFTPEFLRLRMNSRSA